MKVGYRHSTTKDIEYSLNMLTLDKHFAEDMFQHALGEDPDECCGILGIRDGEVQKVYRMKNVTKSPYRYTMDPIQHLEVMRDLDANGFDGAIYHSHTHSEAFPSATDVRLAEPWPDTLFILISLLDKSHPVLRAFLIDDTEIIEQETHTIGSSSS